MKLPHSRLPVEWPIDPILFEDPGPGPDLEFHVMVFAVPEAIESIFADDLKKCTDEIQSYLNDGWDIDDKIICPPVVWLVFSREKEIPADDNQATR